MSYTPVNVAQLYLNRETLTPQETALVERLLTLVEADIEGYVGYSAFTEETAANKSALEYVVLILVTRLFNRITHDTVGIKSGTFQNVAISYDLHDDLSPALRGILDRLRQTSLVA